MRGKIDDGINDPVKKIVCNLIISHTYNSMESQPQNPEFRKNPENFHPCIFLNLKLNNVVCVARLMMAYMTQLKKLYAI